MIVQSKKLIPEIYSQSYDMSIFTGLLDLIYTAREIDVLRERYCHIPRGCFTEDLSSLASLFGLGSTSNRELLEVYRSLVKQKGTKDAIIALAEVSCGLSAKQNSGLLSTAIKTSYSNGSILTTEKISTITGAPVIDERSSAPVMLLASAPSIGVATPDFLLSTTQFNRLFDRVTHSDTISSTQIQKTYLLTTLVDASGDILHSLRQVREVTRTDSSSSYKSYFLDDSGQTYDNSSDVSSSNLLALAELSQHKIVQVNTTLNVYLDFSAQQLELLDLLLKRLAPATAFVSVHPFFELSSSQRAVI